MALLSSFNDDRPVTYFRGYPIYCATILTISYGIGVLATFFAKALGSWDLIVSLFAFDSNRSILGAQIWQILTYSFIDIPSFFTIIGLVFLYVSAVEIEIYWQKTLSDPLWRHHFDPGRDAYGSWSRDRRTDSLFRSNPSHDWPFYRVLYALSGSSVGGISDGEMGGNRQPCDFFSGRSLLLRVDFTRRTLADQRFFLWLYPISPARRRAAFFPFPGSQISEAAGRSKAEIAPARSGCLSQ